MERGEEYVAAIQWVGAAKHSRISLPENKDPFPGSPWFKERVHFVGRDSWDWSLFLWGSMRARKRPGRSHHGHLLIVGVLEHMKTTDMR